MHFDEDVSQNYIDQGHGPLSEGKVDYILKAGLASNQSKLNYYKKVLADPARAMSDPSLRPYAGELLATLSKLTFQDSTIWNRLKTLLVRTGKKVSALREDISDSGLISLVEKAESHEVALEVILEVYSRGRELGTERSGFDRVNSFLAGGKARQMDADLIEQTSSIVETKEKNREALSIARRVIREGRGR